MTNLDEFALEVLDLSPQCAYLSILFNIKPSLSGPQVLGFLLTSDVLAIQLGQVVHVSIQVFLVILQVIQLITEMSLLSQRLFLNNLTSGEDSFTYDI